MGCGRRLPKSTLRRFVVDEGRLVPDPAARRPGRGAYVCDGGACWRRAVERHGFARSLRRQVAVDHEFVESE